MSTTTVETMVSRPDPEVRAPNRSYAPKYKLAVLAEIDAAETRGEIGEIMRREGLYSSLISEWRKQRERARWRRCRAAGPAASLIRCAAENARLRERVSKLEDELATATELIEAQGKVSALLQQISRQSAEAEVSVMLDANVETFAVGIGVARAARRSGSTPAPSAIAARLPRAASGPARHGNRRPGGRTRRRWRTRRRTASSPSCARSGSGIWPPPRCTRPCSTRAAICARNARCTGCWPNAGLVRERRRGGHHRHGHYGVPRLEADGPNQCWTWDITKLRGPTHGVALLLVHDHRHLLPQGRRLDDRRARIGEGRPPPDHRNLPP